MENEIQNKPNLIKRGSIYIANSFGNNETVSKIWEVQCPMRVIIIFGIWAFHFGSSVDVTTMLAFIPV